MKSIIPFLLALVLAVQPSFAGDYPKSRDERRAEEIGSILGGEGIVFRPARIRNDSTKTDDMPVNSFLWRAARDIIEDFAPISLSDPEMGLMSTEWYSDSKSPQKSIKIKVKIKGDVISPESLKASVRQKTLKKGRWLEEEPKNNLSLEIESKILRRARQLYLRKSAK